MPTDYTYTSQRNEASLGLMDYRARYYDPSLNRFIQADSIVPGRSANAYGYNDKARLTPLAVNLGEYPGQVGQENREVMKYGMYAQWSNKVREEHIMPAGPVDPQALNRYSYVGNNPMRYIDPTGHDYYVWTYSIDDAYRIIGIIEKHILLTESAYQFLDDVEIGFLGSDLLLLIGGLFYPPAYLGELITIPGTMITMKINSEIDKYLGGLEKVVADLNYGLLQLSDGASNVYFALVEDKGRFYLAMGDFTQLLSLTELTADQYRYLWSVLYDPYTASEEVFPEIETTFDYLGVR